MPGGVRAGVAVYQQHSRPLATAVADPQPRHTDIDMIKLEAVEHATHADRSGNDDHVH